MANVLKNISVFHWYMGGLFDYIIFKVPLASFYACIAEIMAIYLGDGIIVVAPLITNETSQIEFVSEDFFSLAMISLKKVKNLMCSLNEFPN